MRLGIYAGEAVIGDRLEFVTPDHEHIVGLCVGNETTEFEGDYFAILTILVGENAETFAIRWDDTVTRG